MVLVRYRLIKKGKLALPLSGETPALAPIEEAGSGSGSGSGTENYMAALIERLNELFGGDTTENDQLVYVNGVIMGKLLESEVLQKQATQNSKEQFGTSTDLIGELNSAIIEALDAHTDMSTKAINL